jgi:hypothetical protein
MTINYDKLALVSLVAYLTRPSPLTKILPTGIVFAAASVMVLFYLHNLVILKGNPHIHSYSPVLCPCIMIGQPKRL